MNWRRQVLILGLYIALTAVLTLPVVAQLTTHVAGQGGDPWQTLWRFEHALRRAQGTFSFAESEFFGGGEARLVNISVWPWMGLHLAFGEPAAYNLVFLFSYVLSGYFMYFLVRYLTKSEAPAFLAGLLYMFLPFHVAHSMGHFGAMQMQWLPLAILLGLLWVQRPTIWRALGLAGVVTLQSWSEHHYMLWLGIFGVIFLFFNLIPNPSPLQGEGRKEVIPLLTTIRPRAHGRGEERSARGRVRWDRAPYFVLLGFLVFFFAILPWVPTARLALRSDSGQAAGLELGQEQTIRFSADLFSYVTPPPWQPLWGAVAHTLFGQNFTGNVIEATQFVGWLPLLLLAFFHRHIPRQQKIFWLTCAAVFFVISLGPRLHVFGRVLGFPLPYALVDSWPPFSAVRAVARAGAMVGLAVSVLFGWVLAREIKRPISVLLVAVIILVEFLFLPVAMADLGISRLYAEVASLPGRAIVEIPAATNYTVASQALYASLIHGKEIVGNIALERATGARDVAEARTLPALRQLLFLRTDQLLEDRTDFFEQDLTETLPDVLRYLDAHAILVRIDSLSAKQREAVEYFLEKRMGLVGEKDENVVLYQTDLTPSVESDGMFLVRDRDWQNVGFDAKRGSVFAEIPRRAGITLYNVSESPRTVQLSFMVERGSVRVSDTITHAGGVRQVTVTVAPGTQELVFENVLPELAIIRDPKMQVATPIYE